MKHNILCRGYDRGEFKTKMCNWRQKSPIIPHFSFSVFLDSQINPFYSQKAVEAIDSLQRIDLILKADKRFYAKITFLIS